MVQWGKFPGVKYTSGNSSSRFAAVMFKCVNTWQFLIILCFPLFCHRCISYLLNNQDGLTGAKGNDNNSELDSFSLENITNALSFPTHNILISYLLSSDSWFSGNSDSKYDKLITWESPRLLLKLFSVDLSSFESIKLKVMGRYYCHLFSVIVLFQGKQRWLEQQYNEVWLLLIYSTSLESHCGVTVKTMWRF